MMEPSGLARLASVTCMQRNLTPSHKPKPARCPRPGAGRGYQVVPSVNRNKEHESALVERIELFRSGKIIEDRIIWAGCEA